MSLVLREVACIDAHVGVAWSVAWAPGDSGLLASCGSDLTVVVWHQTPQKDARWAAVARCAGTSFPRTIRSVYWGPTLDKLVVGSFDGLVTLLSFKEGTDETESRIVPSASLEGHESEVKCVAFSASGSLLASCARDKTVWLWEDTMGDGDYECAGLLPGHAADVKHVTWHPSRDDILASASYDDSIRIWQEDVDSEEYLTVTSLNGHGSTVWGLVFSSDGTRLASVSADKSLIVWKNISSGLLQGQCNRWSAVCTLPDVHARPIYSVDWAQAGDGRIATGGGDNCLCVFGREDSSEADEEFKLVARIEQAHNGDVNCVKWDPRNHARLASCGDDGQVRIFELAPSEVEQESGA